MLSMHGSCLLWLTCGYEDIVVLFEALYKYPDSPKSIQLFSVMPTCCQCDTNLTIKKNNDNIHTVNFKITNELSIFPSFLIIC